MKFNNTGAQMLNTICHVTLKLLLGNGTITNRVDQLCHGTNRKECLFIDK